MTNIYISICARRVLNPIRNSGKLIQQYGMDKEKEAENKAWANEKKKKRKKKVQDVIVVRLRHYTTIRSQTSIHPYLSRNMLFAARFTYHLPWFNRYSPHTVVVPMLHIHTLCQEHLVARQHHAKSVARTRNRIPSLR